MDKLRAMQTFVQIADDGTFTAAAATLGMSLPVVVRTLAALEAQLGARLFQRTTRRVALTPEGRQYLARCRDVLAAVAGADASLAEDARVPRGPLVVTAPVSIVYPHARLLPARAAPRRGGAPASRPPGASAPGCASTCWLRRSGSRPCWPRRAWRSRS